VKDSKGTDFWLTFLPNYHNNWYSPQRYMDSLYIFITSSEPTGGIIEYYDRQGKFYTTRYVIDDPTQMYIFKVPSYDFALLGYNISGDIPNYSTPEIQTETVVLGSFHITSEKEVSVYALSQAVTTSDAFLVLPTDVLGNRYFILSYYSDGDFEGINFGGQSTPSEFAIVAVEDNTNVTIYPTTETYRYGLSTQRKTLNKGEVYLVQAKITSSKLNPDLTGTEIVASKPIAVFAGHQRATVPVAIRNSVGNPSRDILIEQLPPVSTWGKNSIVVPFAKSSNEITQGNNIFRVLAAEDDTELWVDGVKVATLQQGKFYEGILNSPHSITASKPILVGAFKKTCGMGGTDYLGDPFFAIMPPVEQYLDEYRIINSQAFENNSTVYKEQFITVIVPKVSWESLRIDGSALNVNDIMPIPGGEYVYANIRVSDGVHYLTADTSFGIVIYGYGRANSYGYIGGSNFLKLNFLEPQITTLQTDSCFVSKGIAYKRRAQDAPLSNFVIVDSLLQNCELYSFTNKGDTIFFSFRLVDVNYDGHYVVYATDTMNLTTQILDQWIPGFTLKLENEKPGELQVVKGELATGKDFCFDVPILNYGHFSQEITAIYLKNTKIYPKTTFPISIEPNDKYTLTFCFTFLQDTTIVDTLVIENDCLQKNLMLVEAKFVTDKTAPKISIGVDSCYEEINLNVSEALSTDKGLKEVKVVEQKNCNVVISQNLPKDVNISIKIEEIYKDTYFGVIAFDSVGNKIEYYDTIPGFTLTFDRNLELPVDVGKYYIGEIHCGEFLLNNYGDFPLSIDKAYFRKNSDFSVIPSTFPITIPPKNFFPVKYCFVPSEFGRILDTLVFEYDKFCILLEVPFSGDGEAIELESQSKCNVAVTTKIVKQKGNSSKTNLFPIPASNILYLAPNENVNGPTRIKIFDIFGNEVLDLKENLQKDCLVEINIDVLPQGVYFLCISNIRTGVEILKFEKY
jgi:hypothetical protein